MKVLINMVSRIYSIYDANYVCKFRSVPDSLPVEGATLLNSLNWIHFKKVRRRQKISCHLVTSPMSCSFSFTESLLGRLLPTQHCLSHCVGCPRWALGAELHLVPCCTAVLSCCPIVSAQEIFAEEIEKHNNGLLKEEGKIPFGATVLVCDPPATQSLPMGRALQNAINAP